MSATMFHVALARKGPRLHDEGRDRPGGEHWALLHLGDLDFGHDWCLR
jgi:hypothetical protein